jgi:hypothetical protein
MWWDWSTAGKKDPDGRPLVIKDKDGYDSYNFKKGDFKWAANVEPEYYWFDGDIRYTLLEDTIDDTAVVQINSIKGSYSDPDSRIWPFKVMRGRQPYDKKNKIMGVAHLFGKDEDAYWKSFDWSRSLKTGLKARNINFSGEVGFVDTEYYWPVTHMVAPANKALGCEDCHARNARLQNIPGVYIPGQNNNNWLDIIGWLAVMGTAGGFVMHGLVRLVMSRRR